MGEKILNMWINLQLKLLNICWNYIQSSTQDDVRRVKVDDAGSQDGKYVCANLIKLNFYFLLNMEYHIQDEEGI